MATHMADVHREKDESVLRQPHWRTVAVVGMLLTGWLIARGSDLEPKLAPAESRA